MLFLLFLFLFGMTPVHAKQDYPSKPVRLIVAWPPGGGSDTVARVVAGQVAVQLDQSVVIDNRGGASSLIGTAQMVKSEPDGYTIGFASSNLVINPFIFESVPFDVLTDVEPLILLGRGLYAIATHPSVPAKSVRELIGLAKSSPEKFNVALAGKGSPPHLALIQFNNLIGTNLTGVSYNGTGPAVSSLVSGETQLMFISYPSVANFAKSDRVRILAITSSRRSKLVPDIVTASESGLPNFVVEEWYGVITPKNVDKSKLLRLNSEFQKSLATKPVVEKLNALGVEAVGTSSEEFEKFLRTETQRWSQILKNSNITREKY
jgi:tripartite-type tricarboxylate transporter receptor subunit TctC